MPMKGARAHIRRLQALASDAGRKDIGQALFAAADAIRVEAQISITRGAVSGKGHVPSKPGEPPMNDTGVLAGYINVEHKSGTLRATVRSDAEYAAALEFGTSTVAARPYLRPARDKMKPEAKRLVEQAMNRVVKKSRRSD